MLGYYCRSREGRPKERFESERQARRAVQHKRRFRSRRFPALYQCPDCRGWHYTTGGPA